MIIAINKTYLICLGSDEPGLESRPKRRIESVARITGDGKSKGDDPEVFSHTFQSPRFQRIRSVFLEILFVKGTRETENIIKNYIK